MSILYFIRHGQASFGKANYDELSQLGELQMRVLGEYWVRWREPLDAVYTGTLERQIMSAAQMKEAFEANGAVFPEPTRLPEFNEYDTQRILSGSIPQVISENPEVARLVKELAPQGPQVFLTDRKAFQKLFAAVMDLWVEGKFSLNGMESWAAFKGRVRRGLDRVIAEQGSGKVVAVVSSGGPISAAMQRALACPDQVALELGWMILNSSVTDFRFSGDKFSLASFNQTPHLVEKTLISYR